jgi:hypothetical protein
MDAVGFLRECDPQESVRVTGNLHPVSFPERFLPAKPKTARAIGPAAARRSNARDI